MVWNNYFQKIDQYREYKGHWDQENRDVWEGLGVIKFSDGSIYQGFTKHQQLNGVGRMSHANGDIYQGQWRGGKAHGFGVFLDYDGSMYEGQWKNDLQHGKGQEVWN